MKKIRVLHTTFYLLLTRKGGQSLMEVILGIAIGSLMILASVSVIGGVLRGSSDVNRLQAGAAMGKELSESVRVFAEGDWHNVANLATSSANKYFLDMAVSPFVVATGTESVLSPDVTSGLVGYWKLDEATGITSFDSSGSNNNGAWVSTLTSTSTCQVGNCLVMSSGYLNMSTSTSLNLTGDMTIAAWVKITAATFPNGGTNWVIAQNESFQASGFIFRVDGATAKLYFRTNQAGTFTDKYANTGLQKNVWYHVAVTKSGTAVAFYINDVLDGTGVLTNAISATQPFHVSHSSQGMDGLMDDVRVYNRALSQAEIKTLSQPMIFSRYFYIDNVSRDAGGNIVTSGGSNDPSTKKVTVTYLWPTNAGKSITTYLTRSRNMIFRQTDWSGGAGQNGPASTTNNSFASSSNLFTATTTGSLSIILP